MLAHYIIIRRDLPLGVTAAMLVHAAGESAFLYKDDTIFKHATAVVLEVKTELELERAARLLRQYGKAHVEVVENSGPYKGQFMAIGCVPCERDTIYGILQEYQCLKDAKEATNPVERGQDPSNWGLYRVDNPTDLRV